MPGLEVWGVLHGAQKDLALLRLLLTAAFHLFPQCAPPPPHPAPVSLLGPALSEA